MKNILYIGPYRQRDLNGIWSRALAHNIISGSSNNVQLRPLFIDSKYAIDAIDNVLSTKEKNQIDKLDTVIQHVPLEQARPINAVQNNILIPIMSPDLIDQTETQNLSKFSTILIDNKSDAVRLSQAYPFLQKNIKNIDYTFSVTASPATSFNIGLFGNSNTKLYMVCNYKLNARVIYDIIVAFIANLKSKDMVLILFTLDITANEKSELEKFIQDAYKAMGINHTLSRVIIAPISSDLNNICIAHKSANTYIDAIDYGSNSINTKLASSLNNSILKINTDYHFNLTNHANYISYNGSLKISSESINSAIKAYIVSKNTSNQISLFKTQHINKYI